ncbi:MAG: sodium-dependent bicarbonate transport family permease [Pseudomonadota bacterium]
MDLAIANLTSPMVLFFVLGLVASLARSSLSVPEAAAKALALYLMFAIGYKGGVSVAEHGLDASLISALLAGVLLSAVIPFIAFGLLRAVSGLSAIDAAAVAAHYGSISIVTFVAASSVLESSGIAYEGYLVAVAAAMETPAILTALFLVARQGGPGKAAAGPGGAGRMDAETWREIFLNGSIVLLIGAFVIGWVTGPSGMAEISAFIDAPFKGVLCLFLLDMGLVAGRGMAASGRQLSLPVILFGLAMPLISAALALALAALLGLSLGGAVLLLTLSASASYIAVPAAMRVALPEAQPSIYLTLSLGVTFPFNLAIGIPIYVWAAGLIAG